MTEDLFNQDTQTDVEAQGTIDTFGADTDVPKGTEKTFTQADVDKVIADRLAREKRKYADYYNLKADVEKYKNENMSLQELSGVLKEAKLAGTPSDQINLLKDYYGLTKKQAEQMVNASTAKADSAAAFIEAEKYARKASDGDVVEEIERILEIAPLTRSEVDNEKFEALKGRYSTIKFKAEYGEAKEYFEKNCEGDFTEFIDNEDFLDFAQGSNSSLKAIIAKYLKYAVKKKEPFNPGSVKDTGGATAKEYYSRTEVDKLTPQQLADPKINAKVRESMTKWK